MPPDGFAPPFYDVTGDGRVTALDALRVINRLGTMSNITRGPGGEGESDVAFEAITRQHDHRVDAALMQWLPDDDSDDDRETLLETTAGLF